MRLKRGVRVQGIREPILLAAIVADTVYTRHGVELVITSITDGRHSVGSLHHTGDALDARSRDLADPDAVALELRDSLGPDYDVIVEDTHIHIEFDPKRG